MSPSFKNENGAWRSIQSCAAPASKHFPDKYEFIEADSICCWHGQDDGPRAASPYSVIAAVEKPSRVPETGGRVSLIIISKKTLHIGTTYFHNFEMKRDKSFSDVRRKAFTELSTVSCSTMQQDKPFRPCCSQNQAFCNTSRVTLSSDNWSGSKVTTENDESNGMCTLLNRNCGIILKLVSK